MLPISGFDGESGWDIRLELRRSGLQGRRRSGSFAGWELPLWGYCCAVTPRGISASINNWRRPDPMRYTRNPLYLGSVLLGAGFSVASHSWISTALLAAYLSVFYPVVIRREQKELKTLYGAAFVEYAAQVPAFWPRLSPAKLSGERFSWSLYQQNREYEAAIGLALAMAVLWFLMVWRQ